MDKSLFVIILMLYISTQVVRTSVEVAISIFPKTTNLCLIFLEVWYLHDDNERLRELRPRYLELPEDLMLLQDLRLCDDLLILREQLVAF